MDDALLPTYDEARLWAYWLQVFTVRDLADAMGVHEDVVRGYVRGMERRGTLVGFGANGDRDGEVFELVPLPAGPRWHPRFLPPERSAPGVYDLAPRNRGMPVAGARARVQRARWSLVGRRRPARRGSAK